MGKNERGCGWKEMTEGCQWVICDAKGNAMQMKEGANGEKTVTKEERSG